MPGPFPGMDPWLEGEDVFPDLHQALVVYLREAMNAVLPPGYHAISKKLVWVDARQRREPDVSALGPASAPDGRGGIATLPGLMAIGREMAPETHEEPYLEILFTRDKRLVTAIELLSRSNKRPGTKGRKVYLKKQRELLRGGANLVEIDLLREGPHTSAVPEDRLRRVAGPFDYHVSVVVAGRASEYHAAPIRLADRLPSIGVPLDPGVPAVAVDLQPLLDRAWHTGRYQELAPYDRPPDPPLTAEQQAWAEGILRAKGLLPAARGD